MSKGTSEWYASTWGSPTSLGPVTTFLALLLLRLRFSSRDGDTNKKESGDNEEAVLLWRVWSVASFFLWSSSRRLSEMKRPCILRWLDSRFCLCGPMGAYRWYWSYEQSVRRVLRRHERVSYWLWIALWLLVKHVSPIVCIRIDLGHSTIVTIGHHVWCSGWLSMTMRLAIQYISNEVQ